MGWDRLKTLAFSRKRLSKVVLHWDDGSTEEFPRDFADKDGSKGNFGESGEAKVLLVMVAGVDGDDLVTVMRGLYDKRLTNVLIRELEAW